MGESKHTQRLARLQDMLEREVPGASARHLIREAINEILSEHTQMLEALRYAVDTCECRLGWRCGRCAKALSAIKAATGGEG